MVSWMVLAATGAAPTTIRRSVDRSNWSITGCLARKVSSGGTRRATYYGAVVSTIAFEGGEEKSTYGDLVLGNARQELRRVETREGDDRHTLHVREQEEDDATEDVEERNHAENDVAVRLVVIPRRADLREDRVHVVVRERNSLATARRARTEEDERGLGLRLRFVELLRNGG